MQQPEFIGKYRIERLVGRGMGLLYRAHDPDLDRVVAVKVIPAEILGDEKARARFHKEAKAAARLSHQNIVTVYEFGRQDDVPYIVMEFLQGGTLETRLRTGKPFTLVEALTIAAQVCDGLHCAHGQGIVHRDVKPANIWLTTDGVVKLLDFGIAKADRHTLSQGDEVVGSAAYMSPEQVEAQPVDARSDVFSLGVVLFELVTKKRPFEGSSVTAVMLKIAEDEPAPAVRTFAADIPSDVANIIERALRKSPRERYDSAEEMAIELRAVAQELDEEAKSDRPASTAASWWERPTVTHDDAKPVIRERSVASVEGHTSARTVPAPSRIVPPHQPEAVHDIIRPKEPSTPSPIPSPPRPAPSNSHAAIWIGVVAIVALLGAGLAMTRPSILFGTPAPEPPPDTPASPPPAAPPTYQLPVMSTPPGARIFIDGRDTERLTPAMLTLERPSGSVRLELSGYQPFESGFADLDHPASPPATIAPVLLLEKPKVPIAEMTLLRNPPGFIGCRAVVGSYRDYPFSGAIPIRQYPGKHTISIECEGAEPVRGRIVIPPGKTDVNYSDAIQISEP